jgi:hypothetical protein
VLERSLPQGALHKGALGRAGRRYALVSTDSAGAEVAGFELVTEGVKEEVRPST